MRRAALSLFVVAALLAPWAARAQTIGAGLGGNASGLVGQPFDIPIVVDMTGRPDLLGAFALTLRWRPGVLQFQEGIGGTFGAVTANTDSAAQGVIRLTGANPAGVGGLVTLGIGRFVPLTADTTTLALSFAQLYAAGTFADLRPSLTVTSGEYCAAVGRYGDINGDGVINSADALIALTNAVGLPVGSYPIALGDVDSSGVTDTRDALIMLSDAVGIDVSAFPRVGRMLGGACATAIPVTIAIAPTAVTGVLVGQEVTFEARASGPTGALMTLPNAVFRSSDTTVLAFQGSPVVAVARAAGSVTVTAVRDGKDSAQTTVTVVARRTTHYVDAKAASAPNQLGTQALPFATIGAALAVARGGDTVRPQPGRYGENLVVDSAIVLLGDTLADGTRPVLAGAGTGIYLGGSGSAEVDYLELDGFASAIDIEGPSHVLLQGIWATGVGYGVMSDGGPIGQLRIESSRLTGTGGEYNSGSGVEIYSTLDTLVVQGTEISDFAGDGVSADEVLSVAVHSSLIHDLGGYGIFAECEAPLTFVMDSTSVLNTSSWSVMLGGIQSAAFSHNHLTNVPLNGNYSGYFTGVSVSGSGGGGWLRFEGDSINQTGSDPEWLDAEGLDSLRINSLWARIPNGYGYAYDVPLVRVTNSQFVDLTGLALEVYFYGTGGRVAIDNVSATGAPSCDLCATAFYLSSAATTANNFTGTNLSMALSTSGDSSLTVTSSVFNHVDTPIVWAVTDSGTGAQLVVRNSQFLGFSDAIVSNYGAVLVDSNAFQASLYPAIQVAQPEGSVQIAGNSFAGVYGAINVAPVHTVEVAITDNTITDLAGYGIIGGGGADSTNVEYQILRNTIACNAQGATSGYGIEEELAQSVISANQVQGCWSGISAWANETNTAVPRFDSIVGNTVTVPANAYGGIYVSGAVQAFVEQNVVTADTTGYSSYGDIWVGGDSTSAGSVTAWVDSNTVVGGSYYGIYVSNLDGVDVVFNTVQDVSKAGCGGCLDGGIVAAGPIRGQATIYGNLVRGSVGTGISASNSDTTTIVVDSNLVSGNTIGMSLGQYPPVGAVTVTNNRITGSLGPYGSSFGLFFYYADPVRSRVTENNIVGNQYGAYDYDGAYYYTQNNWWGAAAGPSCTGEPCAGGSTGDSASVSLNVYPWLAAPVASGLPLSAPPARFALVRRPVAVRAASAVASVAPIARGASVRSSPAMASLVAPPAHQVAARVPAGLSPARAAAVQRQLDRRSANLAARAREQATVTAAVAARAAERAAWLQAVEHAAEQRAAARAAKVAEQVTAQRALHARRP